MSCKLLNGDCLELLKDIPDRCVDLVLNDPPYNIGVKQEINGKKVRLEWDKIDGYIDWCIAWLKECSRVLRTNGVLYFWHNDIPQIAELLEAIKRETTLQFISFCIWDKGGTYRPRSWANRRPDSKTALRSWMNRCEYCLHFFNTPNNKGRKYTGNHYIHSNPACFKHLKEWYVSEKERLGLTDKDVANRYREITGKEPYMLSHYFRDSQFAIPTREVFENVFVPLGFCYVSNCLGYEAMRSDYEAMRNYHQCDVGHCNVWQYPPIPCKKRLHTCQKPAELLERVCNVSCRPGGTVLDCFMGAGSTGVAAVRSGRNFIGIEIDTKYYEIAKKRIEETIDKMADNAGLVKQ